MQRYFGNYENGNIVLSKDDIFHICKVMRNKINDNFTIVSNDKVYLASVVNIDPFDFKIVKELDENHEINGYVRLLYCLPKGEKIDLVIQKAVELGAHEIVLINSSRCVRKFNNSDFSKKLVRYNKIIKESSEQCKRIKLLKMNDLIDFEDIIKYKADKSFIAYENSNYSLKDLNNDLLNSKGKTINILIGAEGGFSKEEVEYAFHNGFKIVSLGPRILRSETSCFYFLSLLSFFMDGDL